MTQDHEYMDTGALTEDAVPEPRPVEQPPIEAPGSEAEKTGEDLGPQASSLPNGAYAG